ncbi:MAG: glycosyltransferase [Elusimicrobiota bacterium]
MKISGATFIRNGIKYKFPFTESIRSVLPLCDEMIVAVGNSEDGTRKKIEEINDPRIRIIDTVWDDKNRRGGQILSEQANIALSECRGDWIFYIQADEVAHEDDLPVIRQSLARHYGDAAVEALAFKYVHFYGSYFTVQKGRHWYPEEVRIIKNNIGIKSFGDAQGFRRNVDKVKAARISAKIYHYGWARPPEAMVEKIKSFHKLWHDDSWIEKNCPGSDLASFFSDVGNLAGFEGSHPAVMKNIAEMESALFINARRAEYFKKRTVIQALRDFARNIPVGVHRNFRLIRG